MRSKEVWQNLLFVLAAGVIATEAKKAQVFAGNDGGLPYSA